MIIARSARYEAEALAIANAMHCAGADVFSITIQTAGIDCCYTVWAKVKHEDQITTIDVYIKEAKKNR